MDFSACILWPQPDGLSGVQPHRTFHVHDFQSDMASLEMTLNLEMPEKLCPRRELTFSFRHVRDFRPRHLITNTPYLKNISDAMELATQARHGKQSAGEIEERLRSWPDLPLDPMEFGFAGQGRPTSSSPSSMDRILDMVAMPEEGSQGAGGLASLAQALRQHLQQMLFHISSHESFRHLEALWRCLHLLFRHSGKDMVVKCRVLPYEQKGLGSALEEVLPELITDIPSVILVDHPFDARPENARLMEQVADMAEMLLVPAICWIGPGFFHLQSWADFDRLAFLPHHLERSEYAKWRTLMQKPASKWVGLTCNRFLLRQPYRAEVSSPDNGYGFDEREGLWASPVYAFAALLEASMGLYGWPTHVSDWKRVRLEGMDSAETSFGHLPTETTFTDDRLYQLSRIGVAPIMGDQDNDLLFTPLDVTLGGEALSSQLFLSLLSREVIQSKEDYEGFPEPDSVRSHLESHFAKVWQVNGGVRPEAFEVQVQETASGCRSRISVKPSWSMLPSGKDLSLSLDWSSA